MTTNEKLIELVKTRINEFEQEIQRCMRSGSPAQLRHFEKLKKQQEEILEKLLEGKTFYLETMYH